MVRLKASVFQELYSQLFTQKALLQRVTDRLGAKHSDPNAPVPADIDSQLQEATKFLQEVETKVRCRRSGPELL